MSAGLLASTVTPGSTAPVVSFTTPANALCACAAAGSASHASATTNDIAIRLLVMQLSSLSHAAVDGTAERLQRQPHGIHPEMSVLKRRLGRLTKSWIEERYTEASHGTIGLFDTKVTRRTRMARRASDAHHF